MNYVIAYDLGTGGVKASLYDSYCNIISSSFIEYDTYYPAEGMQEQNPVQWWNSVILSTNKIMDNSNVKKKDIRAIGVSGHSLGVVAIDKNNNLICDRTPIWSDVRAVKQAKDFFSQVDEKSWYETTGNGFPAHLYSIFKIMWYKDNKPNFYNKTAKFIGTKDYINLKLTGKIYTDYSYASGSGVYNLKDKSYNTDYIKKADISLDKLPEIIDSTYVIGNITEQVAAKLGLSSETRVVCGGVDNACMALGANCFDEGSAYTSLGTSAWIAVSSQEPVIDYVKKPYVFAHCIPDRFVSATCIFSAGRSLKWIKDTLCKDLILEAEARREDVYSLMTELASKSPIGSNKLLFNPSMAGGSSIDYSVNIKGSFVGLDLMHNRADLIRAVLEGIAINLRIALDVLKTFIDISSDMLIVGGGSKSKFWMQMFSDIYKLNITNSPYGQDAGALGAAALAFVGTGIWDGYSEISTFYDNAHKTLTDECNSAKYEKLVEIFDEISRINSVIYDKLSELNL